MFIKIIQFFVNIINNVFFNYKFVNLEASLFRHINLSLLIIVIKDIIHKMKLLKM